MWWIIESKEKNKEEVEEYKEKDKEEVEENGEEEEKEKEKDKDEKEEDKENGKLIVESRSRAYVWAKYWVILREELRNKKT